EICIKGEFSRLHTDKADTQHLRLQLRAHSGRPKKRRSRRRAAQDRDELAAHHSITSSARTKNVSEIARPSVLAVLRLTMSANFVGCSIGRSAGLAPLRMRSTKYAARRYRARMFHAIANESSGLSVFAGSYRGQFVRKRKRRDLSKTSSKFPVLGNHDRIDAALGHGSESNTELAGTLRPDDFDYHTQGRGGGLHRWNDRSADWIVGI